MQQDRVRRDGTRIAYGAPVQESALATNKVLRNTYLLLSMTLLFSAAMAGLSMALNVPYFGPIITLLGYFGLLFLTSKFRNSSAGIVCVFALTGFMGLTLGPLLSAYLQFVPNGGELIMTALGATGLVGSEVVKALLKRRDKLIQLIDSEIKKKGAEEVLFDYTDPPKGFVITYDDE